MELFGFDLSVTLVLVVIAFLLFMGYDWWCHQYFQRHGIPVTKGYLPFFGNKLDMFKGINEAYTDYGNKYGKFVGTYDFRRPILLIYDLDVIKDVLVRNFSSFTNRFQVLIFPKPLDRAVLNLRDEEWKDVRRVLTPGFSSSKMRKMSPLINDCCDFLITAIEKARSGGKPVDCRSLYGGFTMSAVAKCGFGLEVDTQENPDDPFVKHAKKIFQDVSLKSPVNLTLAAFPALMPLFAYFGLSVSDKASSKFFTDVVEKACEFRKDSTGEGKKIDMLQLLINAHDDPELKEGDSANNDKTSGRLVLRKPLSNYDVLAQALVFFFAGYEATNTLLTFTSYLLATNQDAQARLLEEIDSIAPGSDDIGYDMVAKMDYLDAVINETLRMFPPSGTLERECSQTTKYGDLTIEKGMNLQISVWAMHYNEEYWPNPTEFDPDRFSPENKDSIKTCAWMPFGFGPRICLGMRFALLETKMTLVRVLQKYRLDVSSKTEIPPTLGKFGLIGPETMWLNFVPMK